MVLRYLSEPLIRQRASAQTFRRGHEYYIQGAVCSVVQRDSVLEARVQGSEPDPYQVRIALDPGGIAESMCSCPYEWGDWCKHIVAVLLTCLHNPESVEERPPLDSVLAALDREQLCALLMRLAASDASLAEVIERELALPPLSPVRKLAAQGEGINVRQISIDRSALRRKVRASLRSLARMRRSEAYWHVREVVDEVRLVLDQAWVLLRAGDGRNALAMLEAITEAYVEDWTELDDSDGEASAFFAELGPAWTEALLTVGLDEKERAAWAEKLAAWAAEIDDYGVDDAFLAAEAAAVQGWDHPSLRRALQGRPAPSPDPDEEDALWPEELVVARLNVLERQGRGEEYLRLAAAFGYTELSATLMVRLGQVAEATDYGVSHLTRPDQALRVAQLLRQCGELDGALRLAEHGLTLEGPKAQLAAWTSELASALGRSEAALAGAVLACREEPSLGAYLRLQELAGDQWPNHRDALLGHIRAESRCHHGSIEVLLHEGLIADAIAAVDNSFDYRLIAEVAEAATQSHPDWVIAACRKQAEAIMNAAKADLYGHAVEWLARCRGAYLAAGREPDWRAYLDQLIARHARKYRLHPALQALRR